MFSLSKENRAARMQKYVAPGTELSLRAYNLILCLTVIYGLVVNALLCRQSVIDMVSRVNFIVLLIVYLVCVIAGVVISKKSDNAVISFIGYNLIVLPVGVVVAMAVIQGGYSYTVVGHAFVTTAGVTVIMMAAGLLFPQFFSRIGSILFFGLIGVILAGILSIFIPGMNMAVTVISAGLFSLYIGYDIYRSQQFPRTVDNAIDCAVDIYLDIINLFLDLLRIFGNSKD